MSTRNAADAITLVVHESVLREKRHWQTIAERLEPLPLLLFCPACGHQHVDAPVELRRGCDGARGVGFERDGAVTQLVRRLASLPLVQSVGV